MTETFDTEIIDYSDKTFKSLEYLKKTIQNKQFDLCHFKNCNFDLGSECKIGYATFTAR